MYTHHTRTMPPDISHRLGILKTECFIKAKIGKEHSATVIHMKLINL